MEHCNINEFMADVHQNAIAHGWWDKPRSDGTIRSLFRCELAEAMESYRNGEELVWHRCHNHPVSCEAQQVQENPDLHCEACTPVRRKPEGIAVELIDFVIRVLDYLGMRGRTLEGFRCHAADLAEWAEEEYYFEPCLDVIELPDFADDLNDIVSRARQTRDDGCYITAIGCVFAWLDKQGLDPVRIMREKHEYNKTRSYKHGGKVC